MNSDSLWDLSINESTKMIDSAAIKRGLSGLENNNENENSGNNNNDNGGGITANNDNNTTDEIVTPKTIISRNNIDQDNKDNKEVMDANDEFDDDCCDKKDEPASCSNETIVTAKSTNNIHKFKANETNDAKIELKVDNEEVDFLNNDSSNDYHSEYDDYSSSNGTTSITRNDIVGELNERQKLLKQQQIDNHNLNLQHHNRDHHRQNHHNSNSNTNNSNNNQHYHQHNHETQSNNYHHLYSDNQQHQYSAHSEEPEQMRKLFIGGLDYKTSEATLRQHFEKFGDVIDCVVMREPQSRRSRGFGFVIYANSSMVDKAQQARPHEVDGREVQSKRAVSREESGKPEAQATVKKVYLGGLSDDIEETELKDYFEMFGNIVNVNIVAHKDTGKRRGFAFVEYDDYDPVDKIVLKKFHTIKDKRIEAKKAIPKIEMDARKRGDPRGVMAGAMMALAGPPLDSLTGGPSVRQRLVRAPGSSAAAAAAAAAAANACLWDTGPYGADYHSTLDGYPPHYHYGTSNWMMHGGGGGGGESQGSSSYGFRGVYGRSGYANQSSNWATAVDYNGFPSSQGGAGPMRLSYQHRGWGPYGSGYGSSSHRGRGYNP